MRGSFAFAAVATLALASPARGDVSGAFVVRLGVDTIGVEHYARSATQLDIDQVMRVDRVQRRHFRYALDAGAVTRLAMTSATGDGAPVQTLTATFDPDSMRAQFAYGGAPAQRVAAVVPHDAVVTSYDGPWAPYELALERLVRSGADSLRLPLHVPGARGTGWLSMHRLGRDTVDLLNIHGNRFVVRIDRDGRLLSAEPVAGPGRFSVTRVAEVDLPAFASGWMAEERAGRGMGVLSPRDTVRVTANGASLWIDYGRPAKRGRVIFGGVVPYGEVWRTGANAATQFRTDRPLDFGGTVVPAGSYTLWSRPGPNGWKLIVNGETGQWGTSHDPSKDLYAIDMVLSTRPEPVERFTIGIEPRGSGGTLTLDWDTSRASVAFTVLRATTPRTADH
ncbi:MAG TPA: DUF2911 domain-containing protein [Gemmatimonadales bacterium]|nr:DUF2911 domain-containing protein [Gemmatimonadales bacterium]